MSLITMGMAETFPEQDFLDEIEHMEEDGGKFIGKFAMLTYQAYHRGCRVQQIRCMVQYMYHCRKSYEEAAKLFNYPLVDGINLRQGVEQYYPVYARMREKESGS